MGHIAIAPPGNPFLAAGRKYQVLSHHLLLEPPTLPWEGSTSRPITQVWKLKLREKLFPPMEKAMTIRATRPSPGAEVKAHALPLLTVTRDTTQNHAEESAKGQGTLGP